jgi:spore coat polysaccharide biosynthesis protein SpsF (cytidylyltransferase family)
MQAADLPLGQQTILQVLAEECNDLQRLTGDIGFSEDMAKEALRIFVAHDVVLRQPDDQCCGFTVELMRCRVLQTNAQQH